MPNSLFCGVYKAVGFYRWLWWGLWWGLCWGLWGTVVGTVVGGLGHTLSFLHFIFVWHTALRPTCVPSSFVEKPT